MTDLMLVICVFIVHFYLYIRLPEKYSVYSLIIWTSLIIYLAFWLFNTRWLDKSRSDNQCLLDHWWNIVFNWNSWDCISWDIKYELLLPQFILDM